jgi:hypothetical protein
MMRSIKIDIRSGNDKLLTCSARSCPVDIHWAWQEDGAEQIKNPYRP